MGEGRKQNCLTYQRDIMALCKMRSARADENARDYEAVIIVRLMLVREKLRRQFDGVLDI